ncbi:MAG TPA: transglycosylase domain-containing protein [Ilumatobacteraceae bacterium]|nr:transglycosylase domain-containing protein [Ilumatobacteraceae bacterium]
MRLIAWLLRLGAIVVAGALLVTAVVIGVGPRMWRVANAHDQLPVSLPEFQSLSQRSYVYDVLGNVIAVFERENSQPITLAQVPPQVLSAFLAVEDEQFYIHHGVNLRGFARALMSNFSSDAPRQGASTISQQVVKNEFLAGLPRDGRYKGLQAHYATMLEKKMSKNAILERYLNTVFFGNNAYGLQAAAEVYFGKNVGDLTMIEGAFLAGLVRSPSGFDPIRHSERARARFRQVTERLADVGLVEPVVGLLLGSTWKMPERVQTIPTYTTKPTYYTEAIKEYLLNRATFLGDEQQRANLLYRGGLKIHTTFDPNLQALAEQARTQLPENAQGFDAAVVTLDTKTGAIRAMVGGHGFQPRVDEINMALVPRQTGSSIKLFILAAALEAGAQPTDVIDGTTPCTFADPNDASKPFLIKSATGRGVVTLNEQTWASINCAYARLSQIVGLHRVVDTVYRMAHSPYLYEGQTDRVPIQPYASFATGANAMRPLDMAAGMQTIANGGLHHDPYYVDYIEKPDGTRLYTHDDPGVQVLDPGVALTAIWTLKGVLTKGTAAKSLANFPYPAAGKTGTQQDNTNSWFVGATPQLTTAVWVGDPDAYTPMINIPEFIGVGKVQGATYPARIWGALMEPALAPLPLEDWAAPPEPARKPVRLYLPGNECLAKLVSGVLPGGPTTTTVALPPENPDETVPAAEPPPRPVLKAIPSDTTIPPDVLDPTAPIPTIPITGTIVYQCDRPPAGVVITGKKKP